MLNLNDLFIQYAVILGRSKTVMDQPLVDTTGTLNRTTFVPYLINAAENSAAFGWLDPSVNCYVREWTTKHLTTVQCQRLRQKSRYNAVRMV